MVVVPIVFIRPETLGHIEALITVMRMLSLSLQWLTIANSSAPRPTLGYGEGAAMAGSNRNRRMP